MIREQKGKKVRMLGILIRLMYTEAMYFRGVVPGIKLNTGN